MKNNYFDGADYQHQLDFERLTGQMKRIYDLMKDGNYRTLKQISTLTGDPEASISAQLRNFRKARFGAHQVNRKRIGDGVYAYQLLPNGVLL